MSDNTAGYDFRDQQPLWVKYAEYTGDGSDKFYEVRVDLADDGNFVFSKRWGARPDTGRGQIQTRGAMTLQVAQNWANAQFQQKIAKGYLEVPRPYAASNQVYKETGPDYYEDEEAF